MSRTERAALVAIVLLGTLLRLYQLDLTKFGHEEANLLRSAVAWIDEGRFPLTGELGSTGVYPPAGTTYLMAPVLLLARHPLVANFFVAMLNLLSIVILYRLARRTFGYREAILASLIYAAGFWPVYASRYLWDATPIPAVAVLVLDRLLVAATQRRPMAGAWAMAWAVAGMTIHPSAVALLVAALAVMIALRLPLRPAMVAPLLLAGLLWAPYAIYLVQSGAGDFSAALAQAGQPAQVDLDGVAFALWQLFPRPEDPLFQSSQGSVVPGGDWLQWLHPVAVVAFLAALAWCARRGLPALRRPVRAGSAHLALAVAYAAPLVLHLFHSLPIRKHYLFPLLPYAS
ncbi:MAG: glycosyltransferase family 39 protein, partial [Chloroflexi bacterium]|nr:glycosyltransferase family 39 protein [Chloroflexota bacterium]